jgi:FKBP-type peptidyl-prolyl cis-trans isomerase FklB
MSNTSIKFLTLSVAGALFCGIALAQQTPAPATQQPVPKTAPAAPKTQKPAASKTTPATAAKKPVPVVPTTQKQKASYAIGMNIGKGLKDNLTKDSVDFDSDLLIRGMKDAMAGGKLLLTDAEAQAALTELSNEVRKQQQQAFQQATEKNKKEGDAFLAANKEKPGVVTLPSGLQYKIVQPGNGPKPVATDTVVCNYRGTLLDGTEFDSSYKRGQPASFPVTQVIKAWTEALQLMPVGSKWQLFVPPSLGYGERGTQGGPIGPSATLIFDVELVSVQPKPEAKPAPAAQPEAQPQAQPQAKPEAQPQSPSQPPASPQAKP